MKTQELFAQANYEIELEDNLYSFIKEAWQYIEPSKFIAGWHLETICEHLQAIVNNDINRLIINIPPGFGKSLLSSVFFPAWVWIKNPHIRFLTGSYDSNLSIRDTRKCRQLINSDWYKFFWGENYKFYDDQNQKSFYYNNKNGYRLAFSTGGSITGHRGDFIILDDPLNWKDQYSKTKRDYINKWITEALFTRMNDLKNGKIIIIMQRLHQEDTTGFLLENQKGWQHLCLPLEFEPKFCCKTKIFKDKRKKEGDLLWNGIDKKIIERFKNELGTLGYSSQYQQRPVVESGYIFKIDWWKYYKELPKFEFILQAWDTAFKKGDLNDYSVCITFGVFDNKYYLINLWRKKVEFPDLGRAFISLAEKYKPYQILVEDTAAGISLIQEYRSKIRYPIKPIKVKNSKIERANIVSPIIEAGKVYLPEKVSWLTDFLDEIIAFPNGTHDDIVDTVVMGLIHLREQENKQLRIYIV